MSYRRTLAFSFSAALALAGAVAFAQQPPEHHDEHPAPHAAPHAEPHQGPQGYHRAEPPAGWDKRPAAGHFDRGAYQHNFQAARAYHIGPYHRPAGWADHHWVFGEVLPRAYWAPEYLIGDYWLFALEVPPAGYEWVRDGGDAMLINTGDGSILQVEYGVFG